MRSTTVREPTWTEQDRAEMFALELFRTDILCPCGCGFHAADTLAMEGSTGTFVASRQVCNARLAQAEAMHAVDDPKKPPPVSAKARIWTTVLNRK